MKITVEVRCKWGNFTSAASEMGQEGLKQAKELFSKFNEMSNLSLDLSDKTTIYFPKPILQDSIVIVRVYENEPT